MEDAIYMNSLQITSLKGMRNIQVTALTPITLMTGPNGSGKTTFLDAIELLTSPADVSRFLKIANNSPKEFYNLFDKQQPHPYIRIAGEIFKRPYFTELVSYETSSETTFRGYHNYTTAKNHTNQIELSLKDSHTEHLITSPVRIKRITTSYKLPSFHNIAKDNVVKEKVLAFLSLFDNRFSDISSPDFKKTYAVHDTYGPVDESFFSHGIQKILCIADAMSGFHHGILLLDDLECHFSPKTLYEGISFLYSLAKAKQIQLFITTHSLELIDEFLDLLHFYNELSNLKIIRLKSDGENSSFVEFSGKEAYELRIETEVDFRNEVSWKGEPCEGII